MDRDKKPEVVDADKAIRDYYERNPEGAFREDLTEPVSETRPERPQSAELSGGDVDATLDPSEGGTEAVGGSNPTPDQDIVEEIGKAAGVTYQDSEPLKFGDKVSARDEARWELDPASSEDSQARTESTPTEHRTQEPPPQKRTASRSARPRASAKRRPPS